MKRFFPSLALFLLSFGLYLATLAPTVVALFDDSLELQLALPTFAILHPTGYPLYSLLGWLGTHLIPIGDAAFRANLLSALAASLAVALLYPVARRLGSAAVPAFTAALLFAIGPVWWSQATLAEVYAFQGLLTTVILYAALRWETARDADRPRWLAGLAFALGLGLAHHRLTLLLIPALAVFILWVEPDLLRRPRAWFIPILALLAPLLLYATLPLRAGIGSLDGSYAQIGFWNWIMGGGYSTFLRGNPFGIDRGANELVRILATQYGAVGLVMPVFGYALWRMQPRRFVFLALVGTADLLFASQYLVADIEVFLIPLFLIWALFIAVGLTAVWDSVLLYALGLARRFFTRTPRRVFTVALALPLLLWPAALAWQRLPEQDRSAPPARAWGVHDYGRDVLDSMESDAALVGILGEMTLARYFQRTQGIRPDVQTNAADAESDRLAAIGESIAAGRPTYTTRPLSGLAEAFSLSAAGPLVRVWPPGRAAPDRPANVTEVKLTPEVTLAGWDVKWREPASGPSARVRLLWQTSDAPPADFKISARLLAPDGALLAQTDDFPVHNSYPPTRWRAGEAVLDSYDLALNAPPSTPLTLQIILYNPQDGSEIARWEQSGIGAP